MNFRFVARAIGQLQIILALSMFAPLAWSLIYRDGDHWAIVLSMVITGVVGVTLFVFGYRAAEGFYRREALAIVGLGWTLSALMGALPFIFSGLLAPIDAIFEATSGLTATGSTVITDINANLTGDGAQHGVMFWRSFLHWLGGMGIVVLLLALLPAVGAGSRFLFQSEATGPSAEGLKPRIRQTALRLWLLYVGLSVLLFILLVVADMGVYDAMCHTFGTMATAGFSTENGSVGAFASLPIELIIIAFMFLAGTSFNLHYQLAHRRWFAWFRDPEWRVFTALLVLSCLFIGLDLMARGPAEYAEAGFGRAMRDSSFTVFSIGTTTGFTTADFNTWPTSSKATLCILMFVGGCAGSTAGGIKVIRFIILFKTLGFHIQRIFNPRRVRTLRVGQRVIEEELQHLALVYFFAIAVTFVTASLIMATMVDDLATAVTSVIATLNNIGPGLADVGATHTFHDIPGLGKIVLSLCMIAGRLELWAILCLLLPSFWRAR